MTSTNHPEPARATASAAGMRGEIHSKWDRFSPSEIAALKDKDDLVRHLQSKYSFDRAKAQSEVDAFARGRQL